MLLGQDLRRGHQRRLETRLHRQQHRRERHERLARADVALQQPVHGPGRGEVGADLADGAALRAGERERQRLVESLQQLARPAVRLARARHRPACAAPR